MTPNSLAFKNAQIQRDVWDQTLTQIFVILKSYPNLDYEPLISLLAQPGRARKDNRDRSSFGRQLAESKDRYLQHQLLNRRMFWRRNDVGDPIRIKDHKGREIRGSYEYDISKVNSPEGRLLFWKQWFMIKMILALYDHRGLHSQDIRFGDAYLRRLLLQ